MSVDEKHEALEAILGEMGSVAVAFSGGVDSSFLLSAAADVLGEQAVAITAKAEIYPEAEIEFAEAVAHDLGVRHVLVEVDPLALKEFAENPPDRCYYCKRAVFAEIRKQADALGVEHVADGTNADDASDWRPGSRAIAELGVRSPLKEAGLTKADIRELSRRAGLPTADLPSRACLASRFPYGSSISSEQLALVGKAEDALEGLGFTGLRVRHHGAIARVELAPDDIPRAAEPEVRRQIAETLKALGFKYVALDLEGYRTGSLNEVLERKDDA